jgi:hypothetical protein
VTWFGIVVLSVGGAYLKNILSSLNIGSAGSCLGGSRRSRYMYTRHESSIMLRHVEEMHRKRMSDLMGS